jgi:alcohol dehydrogenase (quinone), cytochrome c subunit
MSGSASVPKVRRPLAAAALLAVALLFATPARTQSPDPAEVERGAYLARAGDCTACHTAPGGAEMAGGLPMKMPFGTIYTTNITPDPATGIGHYSLMDFERAVRRGIAPGGRHLYPAMPYPSFTKMTDSDLSALYAYFMNGVPPVHHPNRKNGVPWPLDVRWPLALWDAAFTGRRFQPDPTHDAEWNRGAYLVEGAGHCGACHTPRGIGFQERALDNHGDQFLAGGPVLDGWTAPSLRDEPGTGLAGWSPQAVANFLKTGRTGEASAFGSMADVVQHSTQYLTDDDLYAIGVYLKSLGPASGSPGSQPAADDRTAAALHDGDLRRPGAAAYVDSCAACHRTDGVGYTGVFPRLAGNPAVLQSNAADVISVVLKGSTVPATATAPSSFTMPPFGERLDDQDVAGVVNLIRNSWGNRAPAVTATEVKAQRK